MDYFDSEVWIKEIESMQGVEENLLTLRTLKNMR